VFSIKTANPNIDEVGGGKVAACESLAVPAGTFQCYRVAMDST
jgi:hypothetical protein